MSETDINYLKLLEERAQKAQQDHQEALKLMNLSIINLHAAQQSLEDFKGYIEYKKSSQQKEGTRQHHKGGNNEQTTNEN